MHPFGSTECAQQLMAEQSEWVRAGSQGVAAGLLRCMSCLLGGGSSRGLIGSVDKAHALSGVLVERRQQRQSVCTVCRDWQGLLGSRRGPLDTRHCLTVFVVGGEEAEGMRARVPVAWEVKPDPSRSQ